MEKRVCTIFERADYHGQRYRAWVRSYNGISIITSTSANAEIEDGVGAGDRYRLNAAA
jgi:hypothetical protein